MKKNLGLELNRELMNIAEELTNKKGIKMFYSLSDNYSSATEFFLDVKVSIHGFNKSTTCVVNTLEEATVAVEKLIDELIMYKVRIDNEIIINDIIKYTNNKFETMKNIVKEYSKRYAICIQYDLIGMLEFKKSNKKTITCEDAIGEKIYIDEYKFNGLYSDDCIRLYERD
jgi:hypothetical protein